MAVAPKRAATAYFIFSEEKRVEAREECLAEAAVDKISVAVVAKRIGEKWRALPDDEKARYKELAAQKAAEAASQPAEEETGGESEQAEGGDDGSQGKKRKADADTPAASLPISSVKRIMCLDADVNRVSGDAVALVAKIAKLFVEQLARKSLEVAQKNKRRTIKFADIDRAVRLDRRLVEIGLKDMLATEDMFSEAREEVGRGKENGDAVAGGSKAAGSKPKASDAKGTRSITSFFTT